MIEQSDITMDEKSSAEKAMEFFKNNLLNFLLIGIYGVFLFKDLVTIKESGKTVLEILADTAISFFMGMATNIIMARKGQQAAMQTDSYKNMNIEYSKEIEKADEHVDELDDFCDVKNEQRIVKAQKIILREERINYNDFSLKRKNEVCNDKKMSRCWDKAQHVKINLITPENLISETDSRYERGIKEEDLQGHNRKKTLSGSASKLLMALVFGYFTVAWAMKVSVLWSCIQVAIWLMWGIMNYIQEYFYIKQVYQQKIYRKIKYLKEFNNKKGEFKHEQKTVISE